MKEEKLKKIYNILIVFAIFNAIILFVVHNNPDFNINLNALSEYKALIGKAYIVTIGISIVSLILSIAFGFVLFLMSISEKLFMKYLYEAYTQIALGVPLLVHIVVLYFFLASALGIKSPIIAGILILSGYMSAYFAKTFQGAYNAIEDQQFKIMHTLGLSKSVCMKKIIMPQIIKNTLPTLTSHFSLLIKSTALLSLISVPEFTNYINIFNSQTLQFVTGYVFLAIGYLVITIPLSYMAKKLNTLGGI